MATSRSHRRGVGDGVETLQSATASGRVPDFVRKLRALRRRRTQVCSGTRADELLFGPGRSIRSQWCGFLVDGDPGLDRRPPALFVSDIMSTASAPSNARHEGRQTVAIFAQDRRPLRDCRREDLRRRTRHRGRGHPRACRHGEALGPITSSRRRMPSTRSCGSRTGAAWTSPRGARRQRPSTAASR